MHHLKMIENVSLDIWVDLWFVVFFSCCRVFSSRHGCWRDCDRDCAGGCGGGGAAAVAFLISLERHKFGKAVLV